jgi:hypothetical protein
MFNWKSGHSPTDSFADTRIGRYKIDSMPKRRYALRFNGRIIGVLSDALALRRLAEADFRQRTGAQADA